MEHMTFSKLFGKVMAVLFYISALGAIVNCFTLQNETLNTGLIISASFFHVFSLVRFEDALRRTSK